MFVNIPGFINHSVNEFGVVLNTKTGNIIQPYKSKQGYLYVKPCEDNKTRRNYIGCELYYKGKLIDVFPSIKDAAVYAVNNYGCKESMLIKHMKHKDVILRKCND